MAPFSNDISFLFFTTLLLSLQIHARDSQFFSKVTHANKNNGKETEFPNKEEPLNQPEQEPVFLPETDNSYGLYGHESGQFPPTTTTTTSYQPYKTGSEEDMSNYPTNKYSYHNKDTYNTNQNDFSNTKLTGAGYSSSNNNYYYLNKDGYGGNQNELGNAKYTEGGYNSMSNQNNNQKYNSNNGDSNRYYSNNNNNAANDRYYYRNNAANSRNNGEKQGMSDTRLMEGGKYYYNVDFEKYNPTFYGDSSRGINSENWNNNRGYLGNNNAKPYERNSMEGYQNKEFQGNKDDFKP